ncbi:hypothetical protein ACKVMT_03470 [Halobacteriales archaeon Cl-PHB]
MSGFERSRRWLLASVGASIALAGCSDGGTPSDDGSPTPTETPGATATAGSDGGLDLREANVVGVDVEPVGDADRFSVTLHHDDDGEDGYANWWQVETRDGERLGRRELLHAHGTRKFTRATEVTVPPDVDCVVVRGHDQTHGYGGQAMLVAPESGETRVVDQGAEATDFSGEACP